MNQALFDEIVKLLKDVAVSSSTEYFHENDPGACIHCQTLSYLGHDDNCLITRARKLLALLTVEQ